MRSPPTLPPPPPPPTPNKKNGTCTQNARQETKGKPNSRFQLLLIFALLHASSHDFSDKVGSAGGLVIHKVSVNSIFTNFAKSVEGQPKM